MTSPLSPSRAGHDHTPAHPSGLRQSYTASSSSSVDEAPGPSSLETSDHAAAQRHVAGPSRQHPTEATALLHTALDFREQVHDGPCNHGTFSPRPGSPGSSIQGDSLSPSESEAESSLPGIDGVLSEGSSRRRRGWKKQWAAKIRSKKMSTSSALAEQHGIKDSALMCVGLYCTLRLSRCEIPLANACRLV